MKKMNRVTALILALGVIFQAVEMPVRAEEPAQAVEEQYHFVDGDAASVREWVERYLPGGYTDILQYGGEWWDGLYDYERDLAEFIRDSLVEQEENAYGSQELPEIISIIEGGVPAEEFFKGTLFSPLELEDLYALCDQGRTLDEVYELVCAYVNDNQEAAEYAARLMEQEGEGGESLLNAAGKILESLGRGASVYSLTLGSLEPGDQVAALSVRASGYSGTGHGTIYELRLGGQPALCLSYGKSARSGYMYFAGEGEYEKRQDGLGYLMSYASLSGKYYAVVQIAAWLYLESKSYAETHVLNRAAAMLNTSTEEASDMAQLVWAYYKGACSHTMDYYVYKSANPSAQQTGLKNPPGIFTYTGGGEEGGGEEQPPIEPEYLSCREEAKAAYTIKLKKSDWQTGVGLGGCTADIFENGSRIAAVTTNDRGEASWSVEKTASFQADYCANYNELTPEQQAEITGNKSKEEAAAEVAAKISDFMNTAYTYSVREVTAPKGYVWKENDSRETIAGNGTASLSLTNERTLGAVELIKYDTEAENGFSQGEGELDGAVYGIYAAEDIMHGDGRTGRLYRKNELVATALVGKSPSRNGDGYILNTDGSRHIENSSGTIAYRETPGKTVFGDLELGSYYIKEITPSKGYMLDETIYPVTFTYKDQMVKVEARNERACDSGNELTADDKNTSHSVYTGDYAIKQGLEFVKTSDNTQDTELRPIGGAGFSVYLIQDLAGVKNGTLSPVNGSWGEDDIPAFYDYDFTGEPRAVLYKRTGHEEWTKGDRLWLEKIQGNQYRVKEMFTDSEGRIVTPELPCGLYVIVETTTPENHVAAKPFIAEVRADGGVLYTDGSRTAVQKAYDPKEGIRYGDRKGTKEREGRILQKTRYINNTITKAYLRIVKADGKFTEEPGTYIQAEELARGTVLKEGAGYRLRCLTLDISKKSLQALNWKYDEEGYLSYYDTFTRKLTGTQASPYTTSFLREEGRIRDCFITLPQEIPVGTYELTELSAPAGYVVNGREQTIKDRSGEGEKGYEITETPELRTVFTIDNGAVYPEGQMGTNKYALRDAHGNLIVTVLQKNQEQKGILEIYKHGERLAGIREDKETLLDKLRQADFRLLMLSDLSGHRDLVYEYQDAPLEGAVFDIVAAEDIYSQELDPAYMDSYGIKTEDYLIYRKGETAATITTDQNGWGYAGNLPIGKYKILERIAGEGFVRSTDEREFAITQREQTVSFDIHQTDYRNERQKLKIEVLKKGKETGAPLEGAVYGLYAAEDVYSQIVYEENRKKWVVRDTPLLLYEKDTLVAAAITGADGKALFDQDMPLAKYYVRELEAPAGYADALEEIEVDGSYESREGGQEKAVQTHQVEFVNHLAKVSISKRDLAGGEELPGASLEILEIAMDEAGNMQKENGSFKTSLREAFVSGDTPHIFQGVQMGRAYILRETRPADGYVTAEEIIFRLLPECGQEGEKTDQAALYLFAEDKWERAPQEAVVMKDDVTKVQISKKDIATGEELPGAVLELYDLEEQKLIETWESTETPHYIEKLPIGKYRLSEKKAPEGYGYAEDVIFEVPDTGELQKVEMLDGVQEGPEYKTAEEYPEKEPEKPERKAPKEEPGEQPKEYPREQPPSPPTGDRAPVGGLLFLLAVSAVLTVRIVFAGKRRYNKNDKGA